VSNRNEDDIEATFRAALYPALKEKYADDLKELLWNCFRTKEISEEDKINFLYEFDQLVSGYKRRIRDPDSYFTRMMDCHKELADIAELLGNCINKLFMLDAHHLQSMLMLARQERELSLDDVLLIFEKAKILSEELSGCLFLAGAENLLGKKRGHQPLPYLWPTFDLIEFWEYWAEEPAPYAKARPKRENDGGQPLQAASQFIYTSLALIDPKVTIANTITSINNARKLRDRVRESGLTPRRERRSRVISNPL
jgi:hypothetical protein